MQEKFVVELFDACAVESRANGFCRCIHLLLFFVGESDFKDAHETVGANHAGHRERNVGNAIFAVHESRAGKNGVLIIEDGLDETNSRHGDAGVGEAFAIDNVVSNLNEFLLNSFLVERFGVTEILVEFFEREARAAGGGPSNECRVAVFAENVAVDVLRVNFVLIGEDAAEAVSFEHGAGAHDEVGRISDFLSDFGDNIGRNVERVGDEDDDSLFGVLGNVAEDRVHDFCVGAGQFKSVGSFAGANRRTRADDDDVCTFADAVVAGCAEFDVGAVDASGRVAGVGCLTPCLILIQVNQANFRSELEVGEFVNDCRADVRSSDDNNFPAVTHLAFLPLIEKNLRGALRSV